MKKIKKKYIILIITGILLIIIYIKYGIGIPCVFHRFTGLYCPGCGMTRALISLIQFNPHQAIRYNALIIFLPLYLYCFFKVNKSNKKNYIIIYILLVVTLLYSIFRNIGEFSYLAPTQILN